jgi:hypothetical protein
LSQRHLGPVADHAGFQLGDSDHLLQHEPAGRAFDLREISKPDVDSGLKQAA